MMSENFLRIEIMMRQQVITDAENGKDVSPYLGERDDNFNYRLNIQKAELNMLKYVLNMNK